MLGTIRSREQPPFSRESGIDYSSSFWLARILSPRCTGCSPLRRIVQAPLTKDYSLGGPFFLTDACLGSGLLQTHPLWFSSRVYALLFRVIYHSLFHPFHRPPAAGEAASGFFYGSSLMVEIIPHFLDGFPVDPGLATCKPHCPPIPVLASRRGRARFCGNLLFPSRLHPPSDI